MPARTVAVTLAVHTAPDGSVRHAWRGETVEVAEHDLARFDAANGTPAQTTGPSPAAGATQPARPRRRDRA